LVQWTKSSDERRSASDGLYLNTHGPNGATSAGREKKMTDLWYQCRLRQGAAETVGWIEARGAKPGASVELKTEQFDEGTWLVVEVYQPGMDAVALREKQAIDRKGLPSIERRTNR
jgi:hypothetical protein